MPFNKLPDFVRYAVQRLKILCPLMGKKRIADLLALAGLKISSSSVGRLIKKPTRPKPPAMGGGVILVAGDARAVGVNQVAHVAIN